jgi:putative peptidoglycan lipid II flippase
VSARSLPESQPPGAARSVLIGALATGNLFFGVLHQWYIITSLGAGREADAFFASMLPVFLIAVVSTPMPYVLVPLLSVEARERFAGTVWTLLAVSGALFGLAAAALAASAGAWVPWIVPGFDASTLALAVRLVQVQSIAVFFTGIAAVLVSVHQTRQRFVWVEASGALAGIAVMALLVWGMPRYGVAFGATALALRLGIQSLLLGSALGRPRRPDPALPVLREAGRRLRPLVLGTAYARTDVLVERFLASLGPAGSLALLANAQQIAAAAVRPLHAALIAPIVPTLSELAERHDWSGFGRLARERALLLWGIGAAILAGFLLVGAPVLELVFAFGRMQADAIGQLRLFVLVLCAGLAANLGASVLIASFYALGNTVAPTVIASALYTAGLLLRVALFYRFGVLGIAIAISLQAIASALVLAIALFARELPRRRSVSVAASQTPEGPMKTILVRAR